MGTNQTRGIYLALVTATISGVSIFLNKLAVDLVKPPLFFTTAKNIGVGFLVLGVLLLTGKWRLFKNLERTEVFYLISIGVLGGSLPFYLYFTGLSQIPAVNAALIHKTLVVWVALLAIPFLGERLSKIQAFAVSLLFLSNFLIGGFQGFQFSRGELLVLMATLLWALENVLAKKILPRVDPDLVVAARMVLGGLILLVATARVVPDALSRGLTLSPSQWSWLALTAILLSGYVMSWYRALKYAPATTVAAVLVTSTLVTNLLSAVFVTHAWNLPLTGQAVLMILGVILIRRSSNRLNFWSPRPLGF